MSDKPKKTSFLTWAVAGTMVLIGIHTFNDKTDQAVATEPAPAQQPTAQAVPPTLPATQVVSTTENTAKPSAATTIPTPAPAPASDTSSKVSSAPDKKNEIWLKQSEALVAKLDEVRPKKVMSLEEIKWSMDRVDAAARHLSDHRSLRLSAEERKRADALLKKVSKEQARIFPLLRDAFGTTCRSIGWEDNLNCKTTGKGYRTLELVHSSFVSNKRIKDFMTKTRDLYISLRFTRVNLLWFKSADEYQYYDLDAPKDTEIVLWSNGASYPIN